MIRILDSGRGAVRCLGFAAAAMLALSTVPQRAEALSLINPGAVSAAKLTSDGLTTEVRGGHAFPPGVRLCMGAMIACGKGWLLWR